METARHPYDTIVIGLGCAGVAAASALAKAGNKVLALESNGRIGGRVQTVISPSNSGVIEWGAEWIHGADNFINSILKKHNVLVLPQSLETMTLRSDGSVATPNSSKNSSFFDLFEIGQRPETNEELLCWHGYGYKTLLQIMLNTYNNGPGLPNLDVELKTMVFRIVWPRDGSGNVEVHCATKVYIASNVIVTTPLGYLKKNHKNFFNPPLPKKKVEAIQNINTGTINKIVIKFNEPWWPKKPSFFKFEWTDDDVAKIPLQDSWITQIFGASSPSGCRKSLILWVRGTAAERVEKMAEHILRQTCMKLLKRFFGKISTTQNPWIVQCTTWSSSFNMGGSYSFESYDTAYTRGRSDLAEPLVDATGELRVLFAGEATHSTKFSTTHGAIETGLREARRLVSNFNVEM
ncbi:unnamed protein product [Leptosia nina]|uniref:Amine oxidase domain-containing protein n=1 Tax=Leptosia nina TaxID=320188 RepID=A0AAV1IY70_9NEOP